MIPTFTEPIGRFTDSPVSVTRGISILVYFAISFRMPFRPAPLLLWFLTIYVGVVRLRELLRPDGWVNFLKVYQSEHLFALSVTSTLAFAGYSFGAYLLLYYAYNRLGRFWLLCSFLLLALVCMLLRAFIQEFLLFHLFGGYNYNPAMSWTAYLTDNLYYAIIFLPVGIVYFFHQLGRYNEVRRFATELAHRETELKFLRSQLNPHFLFNTLNNLYSLVSTHDPRCLSVLDRLSGLLRYALYNQQDLVPLGREVAYLHDLIELEQLRVPDLCPPRIDLRSGGDWSIPPLLLLPLVENAFKHGQLDRPKHPLSIRLLADERQLTFCVTNARRTTKGSVDPDGGIGLANVQKRLQLIYADRHRLTVSPTATTFSVSLILYRSAA